jgi:hypothetical protein
MSRYDCPSAGVSTAGTGERNETHLSYSLHHGWSVAMANYKFAMNTITKRPLQQLLTWDDANVKRRCKTSQATVFGPVL